ncbi:MAG: hypothetical protein KAU31_08245, partial [Spirochaetaceae bacterium]|nr:hypothetical protein [Spirochaetaceae bacterium]
ICLQGHSTGMHNSIGVAPDETTPIHVPGDRDFAIQCMKRGLAALCIEQRAFGERRDPEELESGARDSCTSASLQAIFLGRTLTGERIYDVGRALDYLDTRNDVNPRTLGITGNSGGGGISVFSAAFYPRIKFAMPGSVFTSWRAINLGRRNCACGTYPGMLQLVEMRDLIGLVAPKPIIVVHGKDDTVSPVYDDNCEYVERIYSASGAADRFHLVLGDGGHRFYADEAFPVALEEIRKLDSD